jgi:hypothetical protein
MHNYRLLKLIVAGRCIGLAGWTFLSANTNDVLNGGFKNWTAERVVLLFEKQSAYKISS